MHAATCHALRARRRALFLSRTTRQVPSVEAGYRVARELVRAAVALGAASVWAALFLLLAG